MIVPELYKKIASFSGVMSTILLWSIVQTTKAQTAAITADNYSRLDLKLVIAQPVHTGHGVSAVSNHNLYGLGAGYLFGINVTGHQLPLFLEVGPEFSYARRTEEVDYWDDKSLVNRDNVSTQIVTIGTPIDLAYHIRVNEAVVVVPTTGLYAKTNLLATTRSEGKTINLFDEGAHRFQLGWNVGCSLYLNRLCLGLRYAKDFNPFISEHGEKESYQNFDFSIGVRF